MRAALFLIAACSSDPDTLPDSGDEPTVTGRVGVVDVPPSGPYGTWSFPVAAAQNWVNTGLYLRAGETAEISAAGTWSVAGESVGPAGDAALGTERDCSVGSLVARSGLRYEDAITCIGDTATFTAPSDDIVYVGMISSTDLGETYGDRLVLDGELEVTVRSEGLTVPSIGADYLEAYDFGAVESGWVEVHSAHHIITVPASQVTADLPTAVASLQTLDTIYTLEAELRSMTPYAGQPIRWYPDETITSFAYMLAGNPMRCAPDLLTGGDTQRILRASELDTDIWGFAHELGHAFTMPNGAWVYMYVNIESWPNIFTLDALEGLDRLEGQPNAQTYCDGREDYLAEPDYEGQLRDDPFLQLCFLMSFQDTHGADFYPSFFAGMNEQTNDDVPYDGTDAAIWRYVRDRFDLAAGEDTTALFEAWDVPL